VVVIMLSFFVSVLYALAARGVPDIAMIAAALL
jgi:hypothetical protein